jgi:hypothetical protein
MQNVPYHKYTNVYTTVFLTMNHPVEDIKIKICGVNLESVHFVGLCCVIILQRTVKKNMKNLIYTCHVKYKDN